MLITKGTDSIDALAQLHKTQQVRNAANAQMGLSAAFKRMNPSDPKSVERYIRHVNDFATSSYHSSVQIADDYYKKARNATNRHASVPADAKMPNLDRKKLRERLVESGPELIKKKMAEGMTAQAARAMAERESSRIVKMMVLNGGRQRIINNVRSDPATVGWTRVSDGRPCHFCARLVAIGPFRRKKGAASFKAHKGCGCSAKPVFNGDPDGGWTEQNRYYQKLLAEVDPKDWRGVVTRLKEDQFLQVAEDTLKDGGTTFDRNGNRVKSGYAVAGIDKPMKVPVSEFNQESVRRLMANYPAATTLGTWVDKGQVYCEPAQVFATKEDALRAAVARKQIALTDLVTGKEIRLPRSG